MPVHTKDFMEEVNESEDCDEELVKQMLERIQREQEEEETNEVSADEDGATERTSVLFENSNLLSIMFVRLAVASSLCWGYSCH